MKYFGPKIALAQYLKNCKNEIRIRQGSPVWSVSSIASEVPELVGRRLIARCLRVVIANSSTIFLISENHHLIVVWLVSMICWLQLETSLMNWSNNPIKTFWWSLRPRKYSDKVSPYHLTFYLHLLCIFATIKIKYDVLWKVFV